MSSGEMTILRRRLQRGNGSGCGRLVYSGRRVDSCRWVNQKAMPSGEMTILLDDSQASDDFPASDDFQAPGDFQVKRLPGVNDFQVSGAFEASHDVQESTDFQSDDIQAPDDPHVG